MEAKSSKKWIWAVDAFHDQPVTQWRAVEHLKGLHTKTFLTIQPVSCLPLGKYDGRTRQFLEEWHALATAAELNLRELLVQGNTLGVLPPRFLRQASASVNDGVNELLRFALHEGADGIVLTSHARRGPARMILGSFAESLASRSPIPVLVVNPKAARPRGLKKICFPTDFSEVSKDAFDKAVQLAAETNASITLFHKMNRLYPEIGNVSPTDPQNPVSQLEESLRIESEAWMEQARKEGVEIRLVLDMTFGRPVPALLRLVGELGKDTIIAMASKRGPVGAAMLGSFARQVMRQSRLPVMVLHVQQDSVTDAFRNQLARIAFGANPPI